MNNPQTGAREIFQEAANPPATPLERAQIMLLLFLEEAIPDFFNIDAMDVGLDEDPESGDLTLILDLIEPEGEQPFDREEMKKLAVMKNKIIESIAVLEQGIHAGAREEMDISVEEDEHGMAVYATSLNTYVAIFSEIAHTYGLAWNDAKQSVESGYRTSLPDVEAAIALIDRSESEAELARYDRAVDTGGPKAWLQ